MKILITFILATLVCAVSLSVAVVPFHNHDNKVLSSVSSSQNGAVVSVWEKFKYLFNKGDAEGMSKLFAIDANGMIYGQENGNSFIKLSGRPQFLTAFQETFAGLSSSLISYTTVAPAGNGTCGNFLYKMPFVWKTPKTGQHLGGIMAGTIFLQLNSRNEIAQYIDYASGDLLQSKGNAEMIQFAEDFIQNIFKYHSLSYVNDSLSSEFSMGLYINGKYGFQDRAAYLENIDGFMKEMSGAVYDVETIYTSYTTVVLTLNVALTTAKGGSMTLNEMIQMRLNQEDGKYKAVTLTGVIQTQNSDSN